MKINSLALLALVVIAAYLLFIKPFRFSDPFNFGKNKARKALPELARELGLEYILPLVNGDSGGFMGTYNGFMVDIDPTYPSVINIELHQAIKLHLSDADPIRSHLNEGMESFDFQSNAVNKIFTTRFAAQNLTQKLANSEQLANFIVPFANTWSSQLSSFEYSSGVLYVSFKYGIEGYIPTQDVQPMLQDLVALAQILESI